MSRFFMQQRDQLVDQMIAGLLRSSSQKNLARLSTEDSIRVVVRRDWSQQQVALISGGGSGHEPAHAGFVGKGMLTAAVCGEVFASPSVEAILTAIIAVCGEKGCLLLVKNYTGDRLNFGLAAEKARQLGYQVNMIIIGDDIALPNFPHPRGIAGTVLVHKIAGFAAEQQWSLTEVTQWAQHAADSLASLGVAINTCHLPDETTEQQRIALGDAELGLGIHNEPGAQKLNTVNSLNIIQQMSELLLPHTDSTNNLVMLNNLGGVSQFEMLALTEVLYQTPLASRMRYFLGPVSFLTSLDMKGFSLTNLKLDKDIVHALLAPVTTYAWQNPISYQIPVWQSMEKDLPIKTIIPSNNTKVSQLIAAVTQALLDHEAELNQLDSKIGDGDTGTAFALGARDIQQLNTKQKLPLNDLSELFNFIGERLAIVMGGSSGALMSIFFTATSYQLSQGLQLVDALIAGVDKMTVYGGAKVGDRTMIDALMPTLIAWQKHASWPTIAEVARKAAAKTAHMQQARAGRAAYINSQYLLGIIDPGAQAVAEVFKAIAQQL